MSDLEHFYEQNGYLPPARAFDAGAPEHAELLAGVASIAEWPESRNRHLDLPAVARICRIPEVVGRVRAVLGPDLLLWRSNIFAMSAATYQLPWHRDEYNDVLDFPSPASHCSLQINLTDASEQNCVAVIPGSHRWDAADLARRGFVAARTRDGGSNTPEYTVSESVDAVDVPLAAGEYYVFHPRLLHASMLRPASGAARDRDEDDSTRYSITLRIATVDVRVLPEAFLGTPTRAACVLLAGADAGERNRMAAWAA